MSHDGAQTLWSNDGWGIRGAEPQSSLALDVANGVYEVVLGDTHHYGLTHDPFLHERLDQLVRDYLATFAQVPVITPSERWFGVYAKLAGATEIIAQPEPGVTVVNALGGNGMTLSFGLADEIAGGTLD